MLNFKNKYFVLKLKAAVIPVAVFILCFPGTALSDDYKRITAQELKERLEKKHPLILLDIQKKNAYTERHFKGSIRTSAFPARSDLDLHSVIQGVRVYDRTGNDVIIIGPYGGRASQRTVDFLITRGIPEEKIFILEGGMREWPYREMLIALDIIPH